MLKLAVLSLITSASTLLAGPQAIGIVTANGNFNVEGSPVWGNATLFDGSTVETGAASSELALRNGVKVQLAVGSRARIWNDRLLLTKGVGQIAASSDFEVGVGGFHIQAAGARIRVGVGERVEIASYSGTARVKGVSGLELAAITAGRSMSFAMQAAQGSSVTHSGCMVYKEGRFLLQDQTTQEVIELSGPDLASNVGNRVEISGTVATAKPATAGATSLMNVAAVAPRAQGGCLSIASALGARTDVPAGAPGAPPQPGQAPQASAGGGGLSTGAKVGIVAGIGAGAGVGIYEATKKSSTSP